MTLFVSDWTLVTSFCVGFWLARPVGGVVGVRLTDVPWPFVADEFCFAPGWRSFSACRLVGVLMKPHYLIAM